VPDKLLVQRDERHVGHVRLVAEVGLQAAGDAGHLRLCLRHRDSGPEPPNDGPVVRRTTRQALPRFARREEVSSDRIVERRRQHAHHAMNLPAEDERLAREVGRRAEMLPPEAVAHEHRTRRARALLLGDEGAPRDRPHADDPEEVA
jgi:hypothetical protein